MGAPVIHFEVLEPDADALARLYAELFRWGMQHIPETKSHAGRERHQRRAGTSLDGECHVLFYVEVADPQAELDRAESLGGRTVVGMGGDPWRPTAGEQLELVNLLDPLGNVRDLAAARVGARGSGGGSKETGTKRADEGNRTPA